ncbi:uncharacterized protein LOC110361176 isoform X6 [Columba livia]|uniref:uncharacterized protein LOC110361176 isoform X6 n=1 Tax=Columba livia TaxID=8932 RepID=UPI0031BB119D
MFVTRERCCPRPGLCHLLLYDLPETFHIPMSLWEPHTELDCSGQGCMAHDVVVNLGFFCTLQAGPLYRELFLTVAMEGLTEKCPAPSQYVEVAEHLSQHPGVLLPQATPGVAAGRCRGTGLELRRCLRGAGWDPPHPPCWTAPAMVSSTLQHQLLHQLWYPLQPGDDHGQQGQARRAGHALAPVLHLQTTLCHHRCEILTQLDPLPAAHLSAHLLQGVVQLEHQQGEPCSALACPAAPLHAQALLGAHSPIPCRWGDGITRNVNSL